MRKGIISAGSWLVDTVKFISTYPSPGNLVTIQKLDVGFGGCAHNVLVDLGKMQTDIPLFAGGCIGNDSVGDAIIDELTTLKVDVSCMNRMSVPTAYTDVMADMKHGTRTFFHYRGANALFDESHVSKMNVPAKIFHLGYLLLLDKLDSEDDVYQIKAARVLHDLQQQGYLTSVDVVSEEGDRFRQVILPCLPYMNYFIINEVEAGACFGQSLRDGDGKIILSKVHDAALFLLEQGVKDVCVIHFPEGGYGLTSKGVSSFVPSFNVPASEIVSSVGAGDAFCAAMLYALHEELPLDEALMIANTAAYFNLKSTTSTGGAPTLKEIYLYINSHRNN